MDLLQIYKVIKISIRKFVNRNRNFKKIMLVSSRRIKKIAKEIFCISNKNKCRAKLIL